MYVTICGRFYPDEAVVAGYDNRIQVKCTAKWGYIRRAQGMWEFLYALCPPICLLRSRVVAPS